MANKKKDDATHIDIVPIEKGRIQVYVVGESPVILNRMSQKAMRELLFPSPKKNATERATSLKHDPIQEFQQSPYTIRDEASPTLIGIPATAFKGAMGTAALDLPGTKKAQIGRLVWVNSVYVPLFGTPQLHMCVVRMADIGRTPDIRTRAILPRWAAMIDITFVRPLMAHQAVANLLAAAGLTAGVGDWRPEKGKGAFGQFRLANVDDPELVAIMQSGGRAAQEAALYADHPKCFDDETDELLSWFHEEVKVRERAGRMPKKSKPNGQVPEEVAGDTNPVA